jgi:hypothetical protein
MDAKLHEIILVFWSMEIHWSMEKMYFIEPSRICPFAI